MNRSKPRIIRVILVTLIVFAALYLTGRWLQGLYGLDPPNAYFWIGSILQLASFVALVVAVLWLAVAFWRFKRLPE